jgi:hypothetical protein
MTYIPDLSSPPREQTEFRISPEPPLLGSLTPHQLIFPGRIPSPNLCTHTLSQGLLEELNLRWECFNTVGGKKEM